VVAALLALLAVLSLSIAAATLEETGGTGGFGAGDTDGTGVGDTPFSIDLSTPPTTGDTAPGWLVEWFGRLLALSLLVGGAYALYQFYREHGWRGIATMATVGVVLGGLLYVLLTAAGTGDGLGGRRGAANNTSLVPAGGLPGGSDAAVPAADPPTVLAVVFVLALVGAGLVLVRATGDDEFTPEPAPAPETAPSAEAVGRVAGAAADRIARGAVADNEVYRAWREMTDHLDVSNPQSSTPTEFADAAIAAGLAPEDVTALTDLFEAVRYGDAEVTEEREERAVEALRNIETGYT
jgi:hypothetical protein